MRWILFQRQFDKAEPVRRTGRWLLAAFSLAFALGAGVGLFQRFSAPGSSAVVALPAVAPAPTGRTLASGSSASEAAVLAPVEREAHRVINGEIGPGESLAASLRVRGVSGSQIHLIATEMAPVFNFRYSQPGDRYRLVQGETGDLEAFRYERSPLEHYSLARQRGGWSAERHQPELIRRRSRVAGIVSSSLYSAIEALGEKPEIAHDFADIFAWDVDFSRSVQPGDEFSILYERLYMRDDAGKEVYVRPGRILAGRYSTLDSDDLAVYFEISESNGGYYRPDGSAVERQFLKAPLTYRRISSHYTHSRLHPILKVRRPHLGIDYAAPTGTSVWSVADGKVIFRGYSGGFGNLVKVRHSNGYVSYYAHLAAFAPGLRVGQRVQQKQVIGKVGSTGLSTGPHLDFRIKRNGRYVNPTTLRTPAGEPIPSEARPRFHAERDSLLTALDPNPLVVTNEAL